ncbi:hypothetical protein QIX46_17840 [Lysinibacillus boronitolerans]|nr:hypothetical protein QIX46_17840 [Lysinibacillus boronitolerans]
MKCIKKGVYLLRQSIDFFQIYKECNSQRYLYSSLVNLIKSTELFTKGLLLQKEEYLLYKNHTDEKFLKIVSSNRNQGGGPLYSSASTEDVALQLLDYKDSLKLLNAHYCLDSELINMCIKLELFEKELLNLEVDLYRLTIIECCMLNVFNFLSRLLRLLGEQESESVRKVVKEIKGELQEFTEEYEGGNHKLLSGC